MFLTLAAFFLSGAEIIRSKSTFSGRPVERNIIEILFDSEKAIYCDDHLPCGPEGSGYIDDGVTGKVHIFICEGRQNPHLDHRKLLQTRDL